MLRGQFEFYKHSSFTYKMVEDIVKVDNLLLVGRGESDYQDNHALFNVMFDISHEGFQYLLHFGKYFKPLHRAGVSIITELDLQASTFHHELRTDH